MTTESFRTPGLASMLFVRVSVVFEIRVKTSCLSQRVGFRQWKNERCCKGNVFLQSCMKSRRRKY